MMLVRIDFGYWKSWKNFLNGGKTDREELFWLAKACAVCYGLVAALILSLLVLSAKEINYIFWLGILMLIVFIEATFFVKNVRFREKIVAQYPDALNPFKILDYKFRIVNLFIVLVLFLSPIINLLNGKFYLSIFTLFIGSLLILQGLMNIFPLAIRSHRQDLDEEVERKTYKRSERSFCSRSAAKSVPCE